MTQMIDRFRLRRRQNPAKEPIPPAAWRAAKAGCAGTFIEYYDYSLFGLLAVYLAPQFFPSEDPAVSLLAALAVYGVGVLARPLGGIIFGRIGDRRGRRTALMMTIGLMGCSSALMGVLPTYASVGVAAPILLVLLRFAQGLSAGSEMLGSITYVLESAPRSRQVLLASLIQLAAVIGAVVGGLVCMIVGLMVTEGAMASYGWRIPLLFAVPLTIIAFMLRNRLEDSPEFSQLAMTGEITKSPLRESIVGQWRTTLLACGLAIAANGPGSAFSFVVPYLSGTRGLPFANVMLAFTIAQAAAAFAPIVAGSWTDRVGHRRMLVISFTAFALLSVPVMFVFGEASSVAPLVAAMTVYMVLVNFIAVPVYSYIALLYPVSVRFTGSALSSNVGSVVTGSSGGLAAASLVMATGSSLGPVIWIVGWSGIGLALVAVSKNIADRSPPGVGPESAISAS